MGPAPFERRWIDFHSSFDPRLLAYDLGSIKRSLAQDLDRCHLMRLATIIAAAGRARLPQDANAARSLAGPGWPGEGAGYERTERGFRVVLGTPTRTSDRRAGKRDSVVIRSNEILVDLDP